tara:strand:+ start:9488 stop:10006 length:519 start_codon:yes stop_codon:yes gene_type:complete
MSNLQEKRKEIVETLDTKQVESAEKRFNINFENIKMVKTLMDHLNKGYTWKTSNAAVLVTLYDQLKNQHKELTNSEEELEVFTIALRGHELNALYQALLNVEGVGITNARRFITMLTQVGQTVGEAMEELATMNAEINALHTELQEIETELKNEANKPEEVEPELEVSSEAK